MKFVKANTSSIVKSVTDDLGDPLSNHRKVLWLVSGGSNIELEVAIAKSLQDQYPGTQQFLTVLPMDERFGESGHRDSNVAQLKQAGFPEALHLVNVLEKNLPFDETVEEYTELVENAFAEAGFVYGLFGLGKDGHTAGVLPASPAAEDSVSTVIGYSWQDYTRMTIGASWLVRCKKAVVCCLGSDKKEALERLQKNKEPFEQLPSRLLYDIADVTVYNQEIETEG